MRNRKWVIWGSMAGIVLVTAGVFLFLDRIINREWGEKKEAVLAAYSQTMMVKAERVEPFVGDRPYMIVFGEDKIGQSMIAWVSDTDIHAEYSDDGLFEEDVAAKVLAADPANEIVRMTPGKLGEEYIWEVYYKRVSDGGIVYFYDYYRFADGSLIDTYRLGKL